MMLASTLTCGVSAVNIDVIVDAMSPPTSSKKGGPAGPRRRVAGRRRRRPVDVPAKTAYHHGNLRAALIAATVQLLDEVGPHGVSLREVARRAGVTHAAPYRHFSDKETLLAAVAEEGFHLLEDEMRQRMGRAGDDPEARLQATGVGYVMFAVHHPAHFRLMFGRELHDRRARPALFDASEAAYQVLVEALAGVQAAGGLPGQDPMILAVGAWSKVHGLAMLLVEGQLEERGITQERAEELTLSLLGAFGAPDRTC